MQLPMAITPTWLSLTTRRFGTQQTGTMGHGQKQRYMEKQIFKRSNMATVGDLLLLLPKVQSGTPMMVQNGPNL